MKEMKEKMSERVFADTYAFVELFKDNPEYSTLADSQWVTSEIVLVELYYALLRLADHETAYAYYVKNKHRVFSLNDRVVVAAMQFKFANKHEKLSYADCLGYALAADLGIPFLTGDKKFKGKKNVLYVA